jgi:hypothetical protein
MSPNRALHPTAPTAALLGSLLASLAAGGWRQSDMTMANEERKFWSAVAQKYDRVVDLQIGPTTTVQEKKTMKQIKGTGA